MIVKWTIKLIIKKNITALSNKEQNVRKFLGNVNGDEECLKPKQH